MKFLLLFLIMLYCHIIDDFVLQNVLASLKQKKYWYDKFNEQKMDQHHRRLYKNDYKISLVIHSMEWALTIHIPIFFILILFNSLVNPFFALVLLIDIIANVAIHAYTDDLKANYLSISLVEDQIIHLAQVLFTSIVWYCIFIYLRIF